VLNNLVSNAIKFTQQGEVVLWAQLIEKRETEEVVRFSVTDTGVGLSEADREILFQPFSQVSENPQAHAGSGLGLSICQRLTALMGSAIEVESTVGKGTTMSFTLALPIASEAPASLPGSSATAAQAEHVPARRAAPS